MKCFDFEYDGIRLSDLGYMICYFSSPGLETISNGSQITLNTVPILNGARYEMTGYTYDTCLESTFQICKIPCSDDSSYISMSDYRDLMIWLNRKSFRKLKFIGEDNDYVNIFFEASFNVSRLESGGKTVGIELSMKTNRPFALHEPVAIVIENEVENGTKSIFDMSDDEGHIYPQMEITVKADGDLTIFNALEDRTMYIRNCSAGEIIRLDYPIIETSLPSHQIQNDFNWNFFRIANSFRNRKNDLTISIPCEIRMTYCPIVKIGI